MDGTLYLKPIRRSCQTKGKTINLYGKERGLVTDELVLDKVFEGRYASWAAFKKAMYKERVDQFENLKQVTSRSDAIMDEQCHENHSKSKRIARTDGPSCFTGCRRYALEQL